MDSQILITKESKADLKSTWKVFKSHWKTFAFLTGSILVISLIVLVIYFILIAINSDILSAVIGLPVYVIWSFVFCLLIFSFMAVPALYFERGEVITWKDSFKLLKEKIGRIILGGLLFGISFTIGTVLCFIPGLAISFILPVFINKVVNTDTPLIKSFSSSFQSVYKSPNLWSYIGMLILATIIGNIATTCTLAIGGIVIFPMMCIYTQHIAYNKGMLN